MEVYYVKPVENCRLVPVADPRPHRQYLSMTFLAALFFAVAMHSAWQRFAGVQDGYRLEMLQQEKQQVLEANRKWRLEVAALGDPVRIDSIARNQLGMTTLSAHQIFTAEPLAAEAAFPVVAQAPRVAGPLPSQAKNVAVAVP